MDKIIKNILQSNIRYFWAFLMKTPKQDILFYFSKLDSSKYFPYLAIGCFGMYLFCGIESGKLERTQPIPGNEEMWRKTNGYLVNVLKERGIATSVHV